MRTLKEVMMEIWNYSHPEEEPEYAVLKKYIEEVIDACGEKAAEIAYPGTEDMVQTVVTINVKKQL